MCSPCHSIHNAYQEKYIWALPPGPASVPGWEGTSVSGTSSMIQLCTACHAPGKMAEKQVPRFGLHPKTSMNTSAQEQAAEFAISFDLNSDTYPLFTDDGERKASGTIVCSTCHDPHRWDSYRKPEAAGAAAEGNATNSFLRPDISAQFCAKCHGEEALFKFLYFHGQTGRMKKKLYLPLKE